MKKLLLILAAASIGVTSAQAEKFDFTAFASTTQAAWHGTGTYGYKVTVDGVQANMVEHYYNDGVPAGEKPLYQDFALADGNYTFTVFATAFNAWKGSPYVEETTTDVVSLYATSGDKTTETDVPAMKQNSYDTDPATYSVSALVAGKAVQVGLVTKAADKAEWFTIQIKTVEFEGTAAEALAAAKATVEAALATEALSKVPGAERTALEAAVKGEDLAAILTAYKAFLAAVPSYSAFMSAVNETMTEGCTDASKASLDALAAAKNANPQTPEAAADAAAEIIKAARTVIISNSLAEGLATSKNLSSLIVNPLPDGNVDGWTQDNSEGAKIVYDNRENEMPVMADGSRIGYFDGGNWGGTDWSTNVYQEVELPKGKYRVSVLARGSEKLTEFSFQAGTQSVTPVHNGTGDAAQFEHGWSNYSLDVEHEGGKLRIAVVAAAVEQYQWQSFTYFRLAALDAKESGLEAVRVEAVADETVYDLFGRRVENPGNGIYIVGGKKVFIRK